MKGVKGEEIILTTKNEAGKLDAVTAAIKAKGINIRAINAYAVSDQAFFCLVTSDNAKAREALEGLGSLTSKSVVIVEMPDEVGELHSLASRIKEAGIDLVHIYGTTFQPGASALIVFSSNNDDRALAAIS